MTNDPHGIELGFPALGAVVFVRLRAFCGDFYNIVLSELSTRRQIAVGHRIEPDPLLVFSDAGTTDRLFVFDAWGRISLDRHKQPKLVRLTGRHLIADVFNPQLPAVATLDHGACDQTAMALVGIAFEAKQGNSLSSSQADQKVNLFNGPR
jgi:hypothetical protein